MRGIGNGKIGRTHGDGSRNLISKRYCSRIATGNQKVLNIPELKQMEVKSFGVYDKRRPLAPMAQEFLRILREKRNLPIVVNDKLVELNSVRTFGQHGR